MAAQEPYLRVDNLSLDTGAADIGKLFEQIGPVFVYITFFP